MQAQCLWESFLKILTRINDIVNRIQKNPRAKKQIVYTN